MTQRNDDAGKEPASAETALERRARELLRASADRLDGNTRSRLARARAEAVDAARGGERARIGFWLPAGTLAAAAAVAFLVWSARERSQEPRLADNPVVNPPGLDGGAPSPLDDLEILAANESFELLEELEFYAAIDLDDTNADIG
jgi:hypothetical protein